VIHSILPDLGGSAKWVKGRGEEQAQESEMEERARLLAPE